MDKPKTDKPNPDKQVHINTKQTIRPKNKKTTTSLDSAPVAGDPPLRLSALVSAETRSQIFKALEQVAPVDQQRMLNELSAAIKAGSIKTTAIRWFHGVIKRYRDGRCIENLLRSKFKDLRAETSSVRLSCERCTRVSFS